MDGEIKVESTPGQGSTFTFTAIFTKQLEDSHIRPLPPGDLQGKKVLIVDDNQTSLEILATCVNSFRMEAYKAASGEEALALLSSAENTFDLILLDWQMPGLNGIETARRIKPGNASSKNAHHLHGFSLRS